MVRSMGTGVSSRRITRCKRVRFATQGRTRMDRSICVQEIGPAQGHRDAQGWTADKHLRGGHHLHHEGDPGLRGQNQRQNFDRELQIEANHRGGVGVAVDKALAGKNLKKPKKKVSAQRGGGPMGGL